MMHRVLDHAGIILIISKTSRGEAERTSCVNCDIPCGWRRSVMEACRCGGFAVVIAFEAEWYNRLPGNQLLAGLCMASLHQKIRCVRQIQEAAVFSRRVHERVAVVWHCKNNQALWPVGTIQHTIQKCVHRIWQTQTLNALTHYLPPNLYT